MKQHRTRPVAIPNYNEFPNINRVRPAYAKSVLGKETPEELAKENEELKKLMEQMQILQKGISSMKGVDEVTDMNAFSLYHEAILPPGFKLPPITKFTGTTTPKTHLQSYVWSMQVSGCK